MSDAAKWYVVHTYSGYENKVASSIENAVENLKLHDLITAVNIPVETVTEIKDGKKREVERKLFPGYVRRYLVSRAQYARLYRLCQSQLEQADPADRRGGRSNGG